MKITTIDELSEYVCVDGNTPFEIEIKGPNNFLLVGVASTKESMYGAIAKIVQARKKSEIPSFHGEKKIKELLSEWEGGGGGFSGGGASGTW